AHATPTVRATAAGGSVHPRRPSSLTPPKSPQPCTWSAPSSQLPAHLVSGRVGPSRTGPERATQPVLRLLRSAFPPLPLLFSHSLVQSPDPEGEGDRGEEEQRGDAQIERPDRGPSPQLAESQSEPANWAPRPRQGATFLPSSPPPGAACGVPQDSNQRACSISFRRLRALVQCQFCVFFGSWAKRNHVLFLQLTGVPVT
ncbi:putative protein phosphatase 2C 48, partial [Zea mays]